MLDSFGTLIGFMVGTSLIIFGIVWPDYLSNYYLYKINAFETLLTELKTSRAAVAEITAVQDQMTAFQQSLVAGITRFVDLKSILIVLGGSFSATLIAFPLSKALKAFEFLLTVFRSERQQEEFEQVYHHMLEFAELRFRKEYIPDDRIEQVPIEFLREAMNNFIQVDWVSEEMVNEILTSQIQHYALEENHGIAVIEYMGRATPAFGMLGTVVGLILLLGRAAGENADIVGIMGGMSVALITTLYGVLLAQMIFLPTAAKHHRNKESYMQLYEMIREGTIYLHRRERPDVVEQDLVIYLSQRKRKQLLAERHAAVSRGDFGL